MSSPSAATDSDKTAEPVPFDPETVVAEFYRAFNAPDETRLAVIREVFSEDLVFCDDLHNIVGPEALNDMAIWINSVYPNAIIEPATSIQSHNRQIHFTWSMSDADGVPVVTGHDLLLIGDDGKITHDYSFLTPQSA